MRIVLTFAFLLFYLTPHLQTVDGVVFDFEADEVKLLKKAKKNFVINGPTNKVSVKVTYPDGAIKKFTSDVFGKYSFKLNGVGRHKVTFSKSGYSTLVYNIENNKKNSGLNYVGFNTFLRKKTMDEAVYIGRFSFDGPGISFSSGGAKDGSDLLRTNITLAQKTSKGKAFYPNNKANQTNDNISKEPLDSTEKITLPVGPSLIERIFSANPINNKTVDNSVIDNEELNNYIAQIESQIKELNPDDPNLAILINELSTAKSKLGDLNKIIALKNNELALSKKIFRYGLFALLGLIGIIGLLFLFLKKRKEHLKESQKNHSIIKAYSERINKNIKYAALIQSSTISNDNWKSFVKNMIIFNKPKDYVSGDFFWTSVVNKKLIHIVADCTGHGVSGAMLTMMGQSALNQIINEEKVTDPSDILSRLNKKLNASFPQTGEVIGEMDISAICYDNTSKSLIFAGAYNGSILLSDGKLTELKPTMHSIGAGSDSVKFENKEVTVRSNDMLFLMSDGYCDQLTETDAGVRKFGIDKFEKILVGTTDKTFDSLEKTLEKEIIDWQGDSPQTDDIIVSAILF